MTCVAKCWLGHGGRGAYYSYSLFILLKFMLCKFIVVKATELEDDDFSWSDDSLSPSCELDVDQSAIGTTNDYNYSDVSINHPQLL